MGVVLGNHSQFDGAVQGRFWSFPRCLQLLPHRSPHRWTTSVSSATPSWLWARSSLRTKTTPRLLRTYPPVSRSTRRSCARPSTRSGWRSVPSTCPRKDSQPSRSGARSFCCSPEEPRESLEGRIASPRTSATSSSQD